MNKQQIKVIYLDFHGVLAKKFFDSDKRIAEYLGISDVKFEKFQEEIEQNGIFKDFWESKNDIKDEERYLTEYAKYLCKKFKPNFVKKDIKKIVDIKMDPEFELFPDTIEILKKLKRRYRLGLLSNARPSRRISGLEKLGLDKYFDDELIIISTEVGLSKPNKEIYKLAIERSKAKPGQIAYCDDKLKYLQAAEKIGIKNRGLG